MPPSIVALIAVVFVFLVDGPKIHLRRTVSSWPGVAAFQLARPLSIGADVHSSPSFLSSRTFVATRSGTRASSPTIRLSAAAGPPDGSQFQHVLAILTLPQTTGDKIANEAILNFVLPLTRKLSVVLRGENQDGSSNAFFASASSLSTLRRYVGEVYSELWDACTPGDSPSLDAAWNLCNVVVYPQNLPNTPPESWIHIQPDLDGVCSHDALIGWQTEEATGTGLRYQNSFGGLNAHVAAINAERAARKLSQVTAIPVEPWPPGATTSDADSHEEHVVFLEDDEKEEAVSEADDRESQSPLLFDSVAVGGTWDGLHYGHCKLLTLAVSAVRPVTGKLLVGVTADSMLLRKAYASYIPNFAQRAAGVKQFLGRLAPGLINRIAIVEITDEFGPPGAAAPSTSKGGRKYVNDFDALVLSHETLGTGHRLNRHRVEVLKLPPLTLLCTRRTEPHGMSSTAMRRIRSQHDAANPLVAKK
jgi:phosphopantetheine adenylyltransferase